MRILLIAACLFAAAAVQAQTWQSALVHDGPDGRLQYAVGAEGNRIPDFSHAGYRGGGVALPDVPAVERIGPVDGDATPVLQAALDRAASRAPNVDGRRGAVELAAGTYEVRGTLRLRASGVVLRGAGPSADPARATVLRRTGTARTPVVLVGVPDGNPWHEVPGTRVEVASAVVPLGSRRLRVASGAGFAVGDAVLVRRPSTAAWLGAVDGGGTASDPPWAPDEVDAVYARTVTAVDGPALTLDAPLFDRLDRALAVATVARRDRRDRRDVIEEVGVEGLRIVIETAGPTALGHAENAVELRGVENGWVRDVTALHFSHSGVSVRDARHVTVLRVEALEPHAPADGGHRYNLEVVRSQLVLFEACRASRARHAYVGNGGAWDSGIVFLRSVSESATAASEPHRRWGHGFLYDGHTETGGARDQPLLALWNRGDWGTGHGWAAAHSVVWNARMNGGAVAVQKPPTAQNYAVGVEGVVVGYGAFEGTAGWIEGTDRPGLEPASIYDRQLADRLGWPTPLVASPGASDGLSVGPNPTAGRLVVRAVLAAHADVRIDVVDALGRTVWSRPWAAAPAGPLDARLDAGALAPGVYACRVTVRRSRAIRTLVRTFAVAR